MDEEVKEVKPKLTDPLDRLANSPLDEFFKNVGEPLVNIELNNPRHAGLLTNIKAS